ncbi:MAG: hypothetical protein Q8Q38_02615 [bacterium]|nr:hypothetical protein [bacterium]
MNTKALFLFVVLITVLSVAGRFLPHPANFTPIGALALFSGVYLAGKTRYALLLPLVAMLVSDIFLGFYEVQVMISVYGSFFVFGLLGMLVARRKNPATVVLGTLTGSALFFIVTNFAVWAFSPLYPATLVGLMTSYAAAIPFFRYAVAGDLFFVALFFGAFELASSLAPSSLPAFKRARR